MGVASVMVNRMCASLSCWFNSGWREEPRIAKRSFFSKLVRAHSVARGQTRTLMEIERETVPATLPGMCCSHTVSYERRLHQTNVKKALLKAS